MKQDKKNEDLLKNDGFFQGMKSDAVQQQIFGEVWFLRGVFGFIKRRKTLSVFILVSLLAWLYLFICLILLTGLSLEIIDAFQEGESTAIILFFSVPVVLIGVFFVLGIKIIINLFKIFKDETAVFKAKASAIFLLISGAGFFLIYEIFKALKTSFFD